MSYWEVYKALSSSETESRLLSALKNTNYTDELFKEAQEYWAANSDKRLNDFTDSNIVEGAYYSWVLRKMSRTGSHIDNVCKLNEERMTKLNNFKDKLYNYYGRLLGADVKNMNMLETLYKGDFTVIRDYAHTDDGLEKLLGTLKPLTENRLITVFGAAGERDAGKRPDMGTAAAKYSSSFRSTSSPVSCASLSKSMS